MINKDQATFNLWWAVAISTFIALALMIVPVPAWLFYFWPDWIALSLVYWALFHGDRVGSLAGFAIGTLLEVLFVRKFGVQGLGLAMLVFIVNRANQQLKMLSIWQQMLMVGVFVVVFKLITGWLYGIVSGFTLTVEYWYSIVGDMLVWPFVAILLHELGRIFRLRQ